MQVFISWSGIHSQQVATVLREWLPMVIQAIKPWFSTIDIDKGEAWLTSIQGSLASSKGMGIFCLTPDNVSAPWLAFEAGALSSQDRGRVATFLHGVDTSSVKPPLSLFQATKAMERDDVLNLLKSLNARLESPLEPHLLQRSFDANWQDLQDKLSAISPPTKKAKLPIDTSTEMLNEILNTVRRLERISADQEILSETGAGDRGQRAEDMRSLRVYLDKAGGVARELTDRERMEVARKRWLEVTDPEKLNPRDAYPFPSNPKEK